MKPFLKYWWSIDRLTKKQVATTPVSSLYVAALDNYRGFDEEKLRANVYAVMGVR